MRRQAGVVDEDTLAAAVAIWRTEGVGGFYQSAVPNYSYSTPVDVAKFLLYDGLKTRIREQRGGGSDAKLSPIEAAVGGALAAATAQAIATPLDVARVRIITEGSESPGVLETVSTIASKEGVAGLYSGVTPKVIRALASGAIQFSTYESVKAWSTEVLQRRFPGL